MLDKIWFIADLKHSQDASHTVTLQTNVTVFLLNEFPINSDTCSDTTYAQYI